MFFCIENILSNHTLSSGRHFYFSRHLLRRQCTSTVRLITYCLLLGMKELNCLPLTEPHSFAELEKSKDNSKNIVDATENLQKQLRIEKTLKTQAVNKLAEIMNRKDLMQNASRKRKATSDDLRKKEKECRKLHQELGAVSALIKNEEISCAGQLSTWIA